MQAPIFCATCTTLISFKIPELADNGWYTHCTACGSDTALEADVSKVGELATFNATGVFAVSS